MTRVRLLTPNSYGDSASREAERLPLVPTEPIVALAGERALTTSLRRSVEQLPDAPALVWILTSGTSGGAARWVGLSREALECSARAVNQFLAVSQADVWLHALPLFHVGGLSILYRARQSGSRVVAGSDGGRWNPDRYVAVATQERATLSALVPTQIFDLVEGGHRAPPSLRAIVIGGARLDPDLAVRARALGWPVLASYGMTETASQVATEPLLMAKDPSPAHEPELSILPHAEISLSADGAIRVGGGSLFSAIAHVESDGDDLRVRVETPWRDGPGVFETGDLGEIPRSGVLRVAGRSGDRLKILGERVDLEELEGRIRRWLLQAGMPCREMAVVALPDDRRSWRLCLAFQSGELPGEWVENARQVLDRQDRAGELRPFERISEWIAVAELPRTALGKLRRRELEQQVRSVSPIVPR